MAFSQLHQLWPYPWYVSSVSIIFDCSMLLYILFWMFNGLYYTLLYYFWTNLLTQGPVQIAVFFAYFSVSQKSNIKRNPNRMKPSGELFLEQTWSRRLGVDVKKEARRPRGRKVSLPPWALPPPSWAPWSSTDLLLPPIYVHIPQKHPGAPRNPISGAPLEGASITEGLYINSMALPMMCE